MGNPQPEPGSYRTIRAAAQAELKVQRSRFLAEVHPVADEAAAREQIAAGRSRYHDSRHVCYAWRIGHGSDLQEIRSDAGEPSGTAGEPILGVLRQADLTDCVAFVARYFGGIKLGTGGLGRAYRDAASAAVAAAPVETIRSGRDYSLDFPYPLQKTFRKLLDARQGVLLDEAFSDSIRWRIWLPDAAVEGFAADLETASNGAIKLRAVP